MSAIELRQVSDKAEQARQAADVDPGASPVLRAVVQEFAAKATKAVDLADGGRLWEAVVEVEQAGDSAKVAAEADSGAAEATTSSIQAAHMAICTLKAGLRQTVA